MWSETKDDYERLGLHTKKKKILDVDVPRIVIPLTPGKNISVIAEVVSMNYLLELRGIHPAHEYDKELKRVLAGMETPSVHYDEDVE
jgi:HPr kinase/phosphorylase